MQSLQKLEIMMRYSSLLISSVIFIWFSGCTTQGRLTYLTFEKSSNYQEIELLHGETQKPV